MPRRENGGASPRGERNDNQKGVTMAANGWRTEDWVAVYVGFIIIIVTLLAFNGKWIDFTSLTPNFRWTTDGQIVSRAPTWIAVAG